MVFPGKDAFDYIIYGGPKGPTKIGNFIKRKKVRLQFIHWLKPVVFLEIFYNIHFWMYAEIIKSRIL